MEIAALIVSILSIIISVIAICVGYHSDKRINDINLDSKFFGLIFDEFLIYKIPDAQRVIRFNNTTKKLDDYDRLTDTLEVIREKIRYFKFSDEEFYKILKTKITQLEDYIGTTSNLMVDDSQEQLKILNEIDSKISELYKVIKGNYFN